MIQSTLYGVGIGPGDPELLTLKAKRVIEDCPVIAVPKARGEGGSLALEVVSQIIDLKGKEILELIFPMKKERENLSQYWERAKNQVLIPLNQGRDVAFITLGDPLFHSTFIYLMEAIEEDIGNEVQIPPPFIQIIPGVSSIHASTASAKIPLANSHERIAILSATYESEKLKETLQNFDTVCLMKVSSVIERVISILDELGLKERAVFVSRAGWKGKEVVGNLRDLKDKELDYFSMVIVKRRHLPQYVAVVQNEEASKP